MGGGMGSMMRGGQAQPPTSQPTRPTPAAGQVSFSRDVSPIFESRCVICHGETQGLYLTDYQSVMRGSVNGPVVIPGNPQRSRLVQMVRPGQMPYGGPPLTADEIAVIVAWVADGAPNN